MLDINIAMGFRPHRQYWAYQAPIETVAGRSRAWTVRGGRPADWVCGGNDPAAAETERPHGRT